MQPIVFAAVVMVAVLTTGGPSSGASGPVVRPLVEVNPGACADRSQQAVSARGERMTARARARLRKRRATARRRCIARIRRESARLRHGHGGPAPALEVGAAEVGGRASSLDPQPPSAPASEPTGDQPGPDTGPTIEAITGFDPSDEEATPGSEVDPEPEPEEAPPPTPDPEPAPEAAPPPEPEPPPPALPADPQLAIGIDGHNAGWPAGEVRRRAELGAAVTRHEWELHNPPTSEEQPVYAGATQIGTRIHALLGGNEIGDPIHYRDWVEAFVRYWGPGGGYWDAHPELDESRYAISTIELGNEPYFGGMTAVEYADAVRPTLERLAGLGIPVRVILPSYVHGSNTSWIDTLYQQIPNLNSLFYAFADHPYWYGRHPADQGDNGPFERIETLRRRMDFHGAGGKPIYITEYGQSTASCGWECVDEATQAAHLQAMIGAVASRPGWDVELLSIYQLRDRGTQSPDRELQFGLLREDGTLKPAYSPVRAAMQLHRG